jgi:hypothetical protein
MDRSQNRTLEILADPREAVEYLRILGQNQAINWGVVNDIVTLHCEGKIPQLNTQLRCRNTTGIATWLDELATGETATLPARMTDAFVPVSQPEAAAYRIVLFRALAQIARSLHNLDFVSAEF